jgi:hypothetical protein
MAALCIHCCFRLAFIEEVGNIKERSFIEVPKFCMAVPLKEFI